MSTRSSRALGAAAVAGLLAAATACGGAQHVAQQAADAAQPTATASTSSPPEVKGSAGPGRQQAATSTGPSAGAATKATTSRLTPPRPTASTSTVPSPYGIPITVKLGSSCLMPAGTQTITIKTAPYSGVVYDAVYSDGKYGGANGYYGGNAGGHTDKNGIWTSTWVVKATAPAGPVRVDVAAINQAANKGYTYAYFTVARPGKACA